MTDVMAEPPFEKF